MSEPAPLIPRAAITLVTFVILGLAGLAVYRGDYKILIVLMSPLFFILGGDVGAWVRSWRGIPDQAPTPPLPPANPLDKADDQ